MDKFIEYAPIIIVVLMFFVQQKIFVTPEQMEKRFSSLEQHLEDKFVLRAPYDVAISEIKSDIAEINKKLDKIYDRLIKG